jgi:hypothetical protein
MLAKPFFVMIVRDFFRAGFQLGCAILLLGNSGVSAATNVVTSTGDSGPGTLREAMQFPDPDKVVVFAPELAGQTIQLTSGEIDVQGAVTVDGGGLTNAVRIAGNWFSRIFHVGINQTLVLNDVVLTAGGNDDPVNTGVFVAGGAIFVDDDDGASGQLTLNRCTLHGNAAENGGAIYNKGITTLNQCTLTANATLAEGAAIYNFGQLTIQSCTIVSNSAPLGAAIFNDGSLRLTNSIVAGNLTSGSPTGQIAGVVLGEGNLLEGDPAVFALGNYGGLTPTMQPRPESPAVDAGLDSTTNLFATDQRGYSRRSGAQVDIGAVEILRPIAVTLGAFGVTNNTATLVGSVLSQGTNTVWFFNYGPTTNYGFSTPPQLLAPTNVPVLVSNFISGFTPGVTNHCRLVAYTVESESYGSNVMFGSPAVTLLGQSFLTNACAGAFTDPGAINSAGLPITVIGDALGVGTNVITYVGSNTLGGFGIATRNVVTTEDMNPPVINFGAGLSTMVINVNETFFDPGATVTDSCGNSLAFSSYGSVNSSVPGTNVLTYVATNLSGVVATNYRTVRVRLPVTLFVTNLLDSGPGSLRQAVSEVQWGDTILFATNLSGQTISLFNGALALNCKVTIDASALPGGINLLGGGLQLNGYGQAGDVKTFDSMSFNGGFPNFPNYAWNVVVVSSGQLVMRNCSILNAGGHGLRNQSTATLDRCTIARNYYKGVYNLGTVNLDNCTITENGFGAIYGGYSNLRNCTVVDNYTSGDHNSVWRTTWDDSNLFPGIFSTVTATNCIIGNNVFRQICYNWWYSYICWRQAYDIQGLVSGSGNLIGTVDLAPLGNYGGLTMTKPPYRNSWAVNGGDDSVTNHFTTDQRGFPRRVGGRVDIGATEFQPHGTVVTSANDYDEYSLRTAVDFLPSGSTITFGTNLSGQTIPLILGSLNISNNYVIDASSLSNGVRLSGINRRLFFFAPDTTNVLRGLTLENGNGIGEQLFPLMGGGILNLGELTVENSTIAYCSAIYGGAIESFGGLTLNQCTVTENTSLSSYGGNIEAADITVNNSTISGNHGGVGGIALYGTLSMTNSILSGNSGSLTYGGLGQSTNLLASTNAVLNIAASLVDVPDAGLAPLGDYGGPTPTMLPLPGSVAIDAGLDYVTNRFTSDQRGQPRLAGLHVDIGAVEAPLLIPTPPTTTSLPASGQTFTSASLNASLGANGAVTTHYFEYGTTTNFGLVTPASNLFFGNASTSRKITNLQPATMYHYRIVAWNSAGTNFGADIVFRTGQTNLVLNTNDSGAGSLRQVMADARNGDVIHFAPGLSGQTIVLTSGALLPTNNLAIDASTLPGSVTVDGNGSSQTFVIAAGLTNSMHGLVFKNGTGGGIINSGSLRLTECALIGIRPTGQQGAVINAGSLAIDRSTFASNTASTAGAVYNVGQLAVVNSTFTGNHGSLAGAIYTEGPADFNHCTIVTNTATVRAGGIVAGLNTTIGITNSIIAGNFGPLFDNVADDAQLSPLGNYGGRTPTMPPLPLSPVIDNGDEFSTNNPATDQRGFARLSGLRVDIGAVENTNAPAAPFVITLPASQRIWPFATLNGVVSPNGDPTSAYFEYGMTTNYGQVTPPQTLVAGVVSVESLITNLQTATTNYFRLVASNSFGVSYGSNLVMNHTFIVTTTNDTGNGSLRQAVLDSISGDDITFAPELAGQTIRLSDNSGSPNAWHLTLDRNISIDGSSLPTAVRIQGIGVLGLFGIAQDAIVQLDTLILSDGGNADPMGVGVGVAGGAIRIKPGGTLFVNRCTLMNNSAQGGGAIFNEGTLTINNSTVVSNRVDSLSDTNLYTDGGAIYNTGTATLNNCTVVFNRAGESSPGSGGIGNFGTLLLTNTIVAGNQDIGGTNIFGTFAGANNLTLGDPVLGPLGNYGGPTPTVPPLVGSPALNAGTDSVISQYATDQRGFARRFGPHVDIGAVESQVNAVSSLPISFESVERLGDGSIQLRFTNLTVARFTLFASTNVAWPMNAWSNLGSPTEFPSGSGQFEFTDSQATNFTERYYRIRSP